VYHTFYDEVNFYKTHIWRCNGICQHRGPFFGYVRRTANRVPGPNDQWWRAHQEQCGGHFLKVSEPDPVEKKRKTDAKVMNPNSRIDNPRWGMVKKVTPKGTASKVSTIVVRKPTTTKSNATATTTSKGILNVDRTATGSLSNVFGFRDLNGTGTNSSSRTPLPTNGHVLGSSSTSNYQSKTSTPSNTRDNVRDIWSKRFQQPPDTKTEDVLFTPEESNWVMLDDDIEIENVVYETVTILDDSVPTESDSTSARPIRQSSDEVSIKREIVTSFGDELTDSDIELIDHDYDDNVVEAEGSCNKKITDNLFSWNKSTEELNKIHMEDDENAGNPDKELVSCPVCNMKCERNLMSDHLDGCLGLTRKVDPRRAVKPPIRQARPTIPKKPNRSSTVTTSTSEEEQYNRRIWREMEEERRTSRLNTVENVETSEWSECPVCTNPVKLSEINDHLDSCLA
ncbi:DNA-dependent metalloprotease dvc-1, partial [Pseudolycoriella hygida]